MPYALHYWPGIPGRGEFAQPPFAPPIPPDGELLVSHVANILHCLGPKLGLAPRGQAERIYAHGLQLTIADVVAEAHDAHHPISGSLYYEGQQDAAMAASKAFLAERTPKFLGYFETVLSRNPKGPALALGAAVTYVDLSLFQLWEGLHYAFPRAAATLPKTHPHLAELVENVRARPRIAPYLKSPRRLSFNESRIFRHYLDLDEARA